jgi:hypothetical protein
MAWNSWIDAIVGRSVIRVRAIKIVYLPFPECSSVYSNQIDRRIAMTGVEGSPMSQVNVPLCFGFCA